MRPRTVKPFNTYNLQIPLKASPTTGDDRNSAITWAPVAALMAVCLEEAKLPGMREIARADASHGPDPSTCVYTDTRLERNLFRIPLH
jgi:hypothetical protein